MNKNTAMNSRSNSLWNFYIWTGAGILKLFISDVHGDFNGLEMLLRHTEIDFTKDQLILCGDYINRGTDSGKVIRRVRELTEAYLNNVIALMGNHEEMMCEYFRRGATLWQRHGG